jgi:hypothetical protein
VLKKLKHWFHDGDGSAQQRYFYNQVEILKQHGGVSTLSNKVILQDGKLYLSWKDCDEDDMLEASRAKTSGQLVREKFRKA